MCGGLGGNGFAIFAGGRLSWSDPCRCPAGRELAAVDDRTEVQLAAVAGIPALFRGCGFHTFPGEPEKRLAEERLWELSHGRGARKGVYLFGANGAGKTGLAICALRRHVLLGGTGWFVTASDWLDLLRPGRLERAAMDRALAADLLVLDDIGGEKAGDWAREQLFRLLNGRLLAGLPTVLTSNWTLDELAARLSGEGDPRMGERIAWRIAEGCDLIELAGSNLRSPK